MSPLTLFQNTVNPAVAGAAPSSVEFPASSFLGADAGQQPTSAIGGDAEAICALDTIQQQMERLDQGTRRLAVQLRLELEPEWLWAALTDYANLHRFIPNLSRSHLLWRRGNRVGLDQVGTQQFCGLQFSAHVELELEELRDAGELRFRMVQGDFRRFEGTWRVDRDQRSTRLLYVLTVQGKPGMPIGLIEQRLQQDLASNVRGVQQEAMRRFSVVGTPSRH